MEGGRGPRASRRRASNNAAPRSRTQRRCSWPHLPALSAPASPRPNPAPHPAPPCARQAALFNEMKGRIKEADVGVPARYNGYWYYGRTLEGSQYQVHMRRSAADGRAALVETSGPDLTKNSREEVLLDENKRKEEGGFKFYAVRCVVHWEGFCRGTGFQGHRRGLRRACQPGGGSLRAAPSLPRGNAGTLESGPAAVSAPACPVVRMGRRLPRRSVILTFLPPAPALRWTRLRCPPTRSCSRGRRTPSAARSTPSTSRWEARGREAGGGREDRSLRAQGRKSWAPSSLWQWRKNLHYPPACPTPFPPRLLPTRHLPTLLPTPFPIVNLPAPLL
jgi:hypothetical protein